MRQYPLPCFPSGDSNTAAFSTNTLTSWEQWQVEKRVKRRAEPQSTKIDRWLIEESNHRRRQQDVLLICSCIPSSSKHAT